MSTSYKYFYHLYFIVYTDEEEPKALDSDDENDLLDESEAYSSAPVYETIDGKKAAHQVFHYRWRGPELAYYSMEHYAALISVTPRKEKTKNPGRPSNTRYLFHPDHPLYDTHEQQLRSKPRIPLFIGRPPRPPGRRQSTLTVAWKNRARRFARYFLILLRPWTEADGQLPGRLTWKEFCLFVRQLRDGENDSGSTFIGSITLDLLQNIANGLRVNSRDAGAAQDYRARNATVWDRPDSTSALASASGSDPFDATDVDADPKYDKENERTLSLEALSIINQLRQQAAMDDLLDGKLFKRLKYLNNVAESLTTIFEQLQQHETQSNAEMGPTNSNSLYSEEKSKLEDHPTVYYLSEFSAKAANLLKRLKKDPIKETALPINSLQQRSIKATNSNDEEISSVSTTCNTNQMSSMLNTKQFLVWSLFDTYFSQLKAYREGVASEPLPPRIFVHGGPGTGKTFLINAITENLENYGFTQSSCALTGVASGNLPDRKTMHKTFGFKVRNKKGFNPVSLDPLSNTKLVNLRSHFDLEKLALFTIDEISTISASFLAKINKNSCAIVGGIDSTDPAECFGRKALLLCGDMFQFPPVVPPTPLYTSVVNHLGIQIDKKKRNTPPPVTNSADEQGVKLFLQCRKIELDQQMRAADDPEHMKLINAMRTENPDMNWVVKCLEKHYQKLSSSLMLRDPEFTYCSTACTGNRQRAVINDTVSKWFATLHGRIRVVWHQPLYGNAVLKLQQDTTDSIYMHYPEFTSYFVVGAPAILLSNINTTRNLNNGTTVIYHSLILDPREDGRHVADLIAHSEAGEDIFLRFPPLYINVTLEEMNPKDYSDFPFKDEQTVIPVGPMHAANHTTVYGAESISGNKVESTGHGVDLRFGITMHKVQGKTVSRLCVDLNQHDFQPHVNFHGIFVVCSRVKTKKNLAIFPFPPDQNGLQHLLNLKPPRKLILWLKSYDENGFFQQQLLHDQMLKVGIKDNKGKRLKKTQTSILSSPKRLRKK